MKIAPLVLVLLAACATTPPATPDQFVESCTARWNTARVEVPKRTGRPYTESLESYLAFCQRTEVMLVELRRERERRESGAMATAIILGAASDALFVNNFRRDPIGTIAPYRRR